MKRLTSHGYTMIEMVIVLIIISVIAGIAMQSGQVGVTNSRTEEAKRELDLIANAITGDPNKTSGGTRVDFGYVGDVGALPTSLSHLTSNPGSYSTWRGPYLRDEFSSDGSSTSLTVDPWGTSYSYNATTATIASSGSGTTMTRQIAASTADLLRNRVKVMVRDQTGAVPGTIYDDSVRILLTVPNGSGSTTDKQRTPSADGNVAYDSIPIGNHLLRVIYLVTSDTLKREIVVQPNETTFVNMQLPITAWADTVGAGGGTSVYPTILTLYPNGVGSVGEQLDNTGCSSNWQCVDESSPDGNSSFVQRETGSYEYDIYSLQDPGISSGTIDSLKVFCMGYGTHSSSEILGRVRTGGTSYNGTATSMGNTATYTFFAWTWINNPQTATAWTWANINALEAGVGMKKDAFCTAVHVKVYYRP
jgi:general secretion pathway protein G